MKCMEATQAAALPLQLDPWLLELAVDHEAMKVVHLVVQVLHYELHILTLLTMKAKERAAQMSMQRKGKASTGVRT